MAKQDYELDRREHYVLILSTAFAAVVAVLLVVTVVGILKLDPAAPLGWYIPSFGVSGTLAAEP